MEPLSGLRDRIIELAIIWDRESIEPAEDFADAVMALLADADPTDLGYELVGWQLPWGGFHDAGWVPHYEHDLCTPVYARPRPEETPDA